jgi:hypothetical protein
MTSIRHANELRNLDKKRSMSSKLNLVLLILVRNLCASCSYTDLSLGFNWPIKISGLFVNSMNYTSSSQGI